VQELIYTSARKGLKPGTSGFCTVAHTRGMMPATIKLAESLSGYTPPAALSAADAPVAYSHYRVLLHGESMSVLSRVAFCGKDHTNRDNKIAHHLLLDANERPEAGPAWTAQQYPFCLTWEHKPCLLDAPEMLPPAPPPMPRAAAWESVTGDGGWAAVVATSFLVDSERAVYLVFSPGMDPLPLVAEALALIPVMKRWQVTFNTYFTALPAGLSCHWRCCLADQPLLRDRRTLTSGLILDLTRRLDRAPDSALAAVARGEAPAEAGAGHARQGASAPGQQGFVRMPNRHCQALRMRPGEIEENRST
jgi:hypothetical protein